MHDQFDAGTAYQRDSYTTQTLDQYGNVTQRKIYDYTNSATPIRIYNYTHIADAGQPNAAAYAANYIRDRVVTASVTDGFGQHGALLAANIYDQGPGVWCGADPGAPDTSRAPQHDPAYSAAVTIRGNLTAQNTPNTTSCTRYDILGNPYWTLGPRNPGSRVTANTNSFYAAPSQITVNGVSQLTSSFSYNPWMGITQVSGPNGSTAGMSYDGFGRPAVYGTARRRSTTIIPIRTRTPLTFLLRHMPGARGT